MLSHISAVFHRYLRETQFITRRTTQQHTIVLKSAISRSLPVSILKISSSPVSRQLSSISVWERDDERKEWIMQLLYFPLLALLPSDLDHVTAGERQPASYRPIDSLIEENRQNGSQSDRLQESSSLPILPHHLGLWPWLSVCLRRQWQEADWRVFWCHSLLRECWASGSSHHRMLLCHSNEWMRLNGLTDRLYLLQWQACEKKQNTENSSFQQHL